MQQKATDLTQAMPAQKLMLQCILHVAQHPDSDLRKCLENALKNTTEVGLRQTGRAVA